MTRLLAGIGTVGNVGYAVPILPVLFARAPLIFRIPPVIYLAVSLYILARAARSPS